MKIIEEFKEFAIKGNVIDLAVGVIIGAAFGKIVTSLVNDIIMPPIGLLTGEVDFSEKAIIIKQASESVEAVTINYGIFINNTVNFIIVAFAIFIIIKQINKMKRKEEAKPPAEKKESADITLLREIRDSLNK